MNVSHFPQFFLVSNPKYRIYFSNSGFPSYKKMNGAKERVSISFSFLQLPTTVGGTLRAPSVQGDFRIHPIKVI